MRIGRAQNAELSQVSGSARQTRVSGEGEQTRDVDVLRGRRPKSGTVAHQTKHEAMANDGED
jgi:hypothetical protein